MKKIIKVLFISVVATLVALSLLACTGSKPEEIPGVINGSSGSGNYANDSAYGSNPDLDNVIIDGFLEDELWTSDSMKWYTHYDATSRISYKMSATVSDGGLYVAFRSDDPIIAWHGYNYFFRNTNVSFTIYGSDFGGKNVTISLDANNIRPSTWYVNARSRYYGDINLIGKGEGISAEVYMTWADMSANLQNGTPEEIKILPVYNYAASPSASTTTAMLPTFVKTSGNANQAIKFNKNGYADGDHRDAIVGSHSSGMAKTNGWKVSGSESGEETATSDMSATRGFPQAIFFRDVMATRFKATMTVKLSELAQDSRVGILLYRDAINYRAIAFNYNKKNVVGGKTTEHSLYGYTNYPANVTTGKKLYTVKSEPTDKIKLTVYNNAGNLYYVVNEEYACSEVVPYVSVNNYIALYAFDVNATFYDYSCTAFDSESELLNDFGKYAYTVNVLNEDAAHLVAEASQIAVKKNNGVAEITMTCSEGYAPDNMYYVLATSGEEISLEDVAKNGKGGVFSFLVTDNVYVYTSTKKIDENQLITLGMQSYDKNTGERIFGTEATLIGSGPYSRYRVKFDNRGATIKVPKGNSWEYVISGQGYSLTEGKLFDGEALSESTTEGKLFVTPMAMGGTANSVLGADGKPVFGFTKTSTPGTVWDLTEGEEGHAVYTTSYTDKGEVYFSGRTISDYQVAYVEIINRTDPSAFTSFENDPAAGFVIAGPNMTSFIGLCGTGIRILPNKSVFNYNRTEVRNVMKYYGHLGNVDRSNGGRYISSYEGTGTCNRIPNEDVEYVTSYMLIRKNGYNYLYGCDGSAGVTTDKTNLGKLKHIYTYYNEEVKNEAAIGFGLTVGYNLRMDFENYWLLAGDKAAAFADDMIAMDFTVSGADKVDISGDAFISYQSEEGIGKGKIVKSSKLKVSAAEALADGKMLKLDFSTGETYYVNKYNSVVNYTYSGSGSTFAVTVSEVECTTVYGEVKTPDGMAKQVYEGVVLDAAGNVIQNITTTEAGNFAIEVEKGIDLFVSFTLDGYGMAPVSTERGALGVLEFVSLDFGGKVVRQDGTIVTTPSYVSMGVSKEGEQYFEANSTAAKNEGVYIKTEKLTTNSVIEFKYTRKAMPIGAPYTEDGDSGIGVSYFGVSGSYGICLIGTGYRITRNNEYSVEHNIDVRDISPVNVGFKAVISPYYVKYAKVGSVVYVLAKASEKDQYTLITAFDIMPHVGSTNVDARISWTTAGWYSIRVADVRVYEPDADEIAAIKNETVSANIKVEGKEFINLSGAGVLSYDSATGMGKIARSSNVTISGNNLSADEMLRVTANGADYYISGSEAVSLRLNTTTTVNVIVEKIAVYAVSGKVVMPDNVNAASVIGYVYDEQFNEISQLKVDSKGEFTAYVDKNAKHTICFHAGDYAMKPVPVTASGDVGDLTFTKTNVLSSVKLQDGTTSESFDGVRYYLDENGKACVRYKNAKGKNGGVYVDPALLREDMVITFSYTRKAKPVGEAGSEDKDASMGLVLVGPTGRYGLRFIGKGYRIQRNDNYSTQTNVQNSSAGSPVDLSKTSVSEPYDFKFIKLGSMVYMCAKKHTEKSYTLITSFDVMNSDYSVGGKLNSVMLSWATNGWTDVTFSGITVEPASESNTTEIK